MKHHHMSDHWTIKTLQLPGKIPKSGAELCQAQAKLSKLVKAS